MTPICGTEHKWGSTRIITWTKAAYRRETLASLFRIWPRGWKHPTKENSKQKHWRFWTRGMIRCRPNFCTLSIDAAWPQFGRFLILADPYQSAQTRLWITPRNPPMAGSWYRQKSAECARQAMDARRTDSDRANCKMQAKLWLQIAARVDKNADAEQRAVALRNAGNGARRSPSSCPRGGSFAALALSQPTFVKRAAVGLWRPDDIPQTFRRHEAWP